MRENLTYGLMRGNREGPLGVQGLATEALAWKRGVNELAKEPTDIGSKPNLFSTLRKGALR
jgi:hypothetical protein